MLIQELLQSLLRKLATQRNSNTKEGRETKKKILDLIPSLLVDLDSQTIVDASRTVEMMFGYPKGELKGKNLEILIPERYREHHRVLVKEFSEDPILGAMNRHKRVERLYGRKRDGEEIEVTVGLVPEEGSPMCVAVVFPQKERK